MAGAYTQTRRGGHMAVASSSFDRFGGQRLVAIAASAAAATTVTATAAATTAVAAASAAAATATGAVFAWAGFVDGQRAAVMLLAVQSSDGRLGLAVIGHLHKAKALAA